MRGVKSFTLSTYFGLTTRYRRSGYNDTTFIIHHMLQQYGTCGVKGDRLFELINRGVSEENSFSYLSTKKALSWLVHRGFAVLEKDRYRSVISFKDLDHRYQHYFSKDISHPDFFVKLTFDELKSHGKHIMTVVIGQMLHHFIHSDNGTMISIHDFKKFRLTNIKARLCYLKSIGMVDVLQNMIPINAYEKHLIDGKLPKKYKLQAPNTYKINPSVSDIRVSIKDIKNLFIIKSLFHCKKFCIPKSDDELHDLMNQLHEQSDAKSQKISLCGTIGNDARLLEKVMSQHNRIFAYNIKKYAYIYPEVALSFI